MHPNGGWWAVAGALAVVLASICYAASSLYIQRSLVVGGLELATASVLCGAAAMLPFALADLPTSVGWKPLASVVVLGIVGTGFAQLIVNRLIGDHGPARSMLVNYLLPGFALFYGVTQGSFGIAEIIGRGFDTFSDMIKSGDFDRFLVRPRSTTLQVAGREFDGRIGRLLPTTFARGERRSSGA